MSATLATSYLGLSLKNPLVPGASPLDEQLDRARAFEDAGAPALVMHSLFEEQIEGEIRAEHAHVRRHRDNFAEAGTFFPAADDYALGPQEYLEHIRRLKERLSIPVIASLNGRALGGWVRYASLIEQAGADALELNLYTVPTDSTVDGARLESEQLEIVEAVRSSVRLPLAVKLSPFYSSLPHFAKELELFGAQGLVLFNRFYQPEIDLGEMDVVPRLELSTSSELHLRLRWLAILSPQRILDFACSGGVHTPEDAVKALLAGATTVQVVSALLRHGPGGYAWLLQGIKDWMDQHEYASVDQLRGALSQKHCPDPGAFERANYLRALQLWRG